VSNFLATVYDGENKILCDEVMIIFVFTLDQTL